MHIRAVEQSLLSSITGCNTSTLEGAGTAGNPYKVCSTSQLAGMHDAVAGTVYSLQRDIDLTGVTFKPIVNFNGIFYGNGHSIIGHNYSAPASNLVGLFDQLATGVEIHSLVLDSPKIEGNTGVGALAGKIMGVAPGSVIVDQVTIKNAVVSGQRGVGALSGAADVATISNLVVSKARLIGDQYVGLIAGRSTNLATVNDAQLDGLINASMYAGGIFGSVSNGILNRIAVNANVTTDPDTAQATNIGVSLGIVGGMYGHVDNTVTTDSYYLGTIVATANAFSGIGAYAGEASNSQVVTSYFSVNNMVDFVGSGTNYHGLVGIDDATNIIDFTYFYKHAYLADATNNADFIAINTTGELSAAVTYSGFDFTNKWKLSTGSFTSPVLTAQNAKAAFGDVTYRQTSHGPVTLTETEDATGYLFPNTRSDEFKYVYLTLTNKSGSTIYLKDAATTLSNSFLLATGTYAGTCPVYVAAGAPLFNNQTCTFGVRFNPYIDLDGPVSDSFMVNYAMVSSTGVLNNVSHKLDGYGTAINPYIADDTYNFGNGIAMAPATVADYNLNNTGLADLEIVSYTVTGSAFTVDSSNCAVGTLVTAGNNCVLHLSFAPTAIQAYSETLDVVYQDIATLKNRTMTLTLQGAGIQNPFNHDPAVSCKLANGSAAYPFCVYDDVELALVSSYAANYFIQTQDIDLTALGCNGLAPIMNFSGGYNGQNHTISNFCYHDVALSSLGLFQGWTSGSISNIVMTGADVIGADQVGILVGHYASTNTISNCHVTGTVVGNNFAAGLVGNADTAASTITGCSATGTVTGVFSTGGLVGLANAAGLTISNSHAAVNVTATAQYTGGLVGFPIITTITNSYATGNVSGTWAVGGLFGQGNTLTLTNSYATGIVNGSAAFGLIGGLGGIATAAGTVSNSYATGNVNAAGSDSVGGLFGASDYAIDHSYATGKVTGNTDVGGLIGSQSGSVSLSYATGIVSGTAKTGGFVGASSVVGTITDSFASGNTSGTTEVAGFVGENSGTISGSFAAKSTLLATGDYVGGFVGRNSGGTINNSVSAVLSVATAGNYSGGFVGYSTGAINFSYTMANAVSGSSFANPFLGFNDLGSVTSCYYNSDIGVGDGNATGVPSVAMTNAGVFAGFDFTTPLWKVPTSIILAISSFRGPVPVGMCSLPASGITCP